MIILEIYNPGHIIPFKNKLLRTPLKIKIPESKKNFYSVLIKKNGINKYKFIENVPDDDSKKIEEENNKLEIIRKSLKKLDKEEKTAKNIPPNLKITPKKKTTYKKPIPPTKVYPEEVKKVQAKPKPEPKIEEKTLPIKKKPVVKKEKSEPDIELLSNDNDIINKILNEDVSIMDILEREGK